MPTTSASLVRVGCLLIGMLASAGCDIILGIEPPRARAAAGGSDGQGGEAGAEPGGKAGAEPGGRAGSEPGGAAGEAGTASGGMSGGDAGGSHGGSVTTGGFGGAPTVAPGDLVLEVSDVPAACTGEGVTVELTANGGTAPYTWTLLEVESGFELRGHGNTATLTGTAQAAGAQTLHVTVTDASDETEELPVEITTHPTPVVEPLTLPSVCPNEIYRAELVASGGDEASYEWTTDLPEDTGLRVTSNFLEGHVAREWTEASTIDFTVTVNDGRCSAVAPATLDWASPTADECPAIRVEYALPNQPPLAPCMGNEYHTELFVRGGGVNDEWQATSVPEGLYFDPDAQTISGVPTQAGGVTVQVTDGSGRTVEQSYWLEPRHRCWFAYVASKGGPAHLELFDPVLGSRRRLPSGQTAADVRDFKFSPNGKFLAYRAAAPDAPARLTLVDLATWQETIIDASGVTYYTWSDSSSLLAVAFTTSEGAFVGSVDVSQLESIGATASPPAGTVEVPVDSDPKWLGDATLAFMTRDRHGMLRFTTSKRGPVGFEPPATDLTTFYEFGTALLPAPAGLFAAFDPWTMVFYADDGSDPVIHMNVILAPSGTYAARVQPSDSAPVILQPALFHARRSSLSGEAPSSQVGACDTLLAWAEERERFACAYRTSPDIVDQLIIYDVDPKAHVPSPLGASGVHGTFNYPSNSHIERRRVFSRLGSRLALSTDAGLIIASLGSGTPHAVQLPLRTNTIAPNNRFSDLLFSPNELLLLQRRGKRLSLFQVDEDTPRELILSETMLPSMPCGEEFPDLENGWCGSEHPHAPFSWAPDSSLVAFQEEDGTLEIVDVSVRDAPNPIPTDDECGTGCVVNSQFRFQP